MKTWQITTGIIFLILALTIMHNPSYAQIPQNPCYPLYQDPYFGNCEQLSGIYLPPVANRTLDVLIKTEPQVLTANTTEDRILHIEFFDKGTNRPISYLSFILNVTKGDQRLMSDRFFNINGTSTINFQNAGTLGKWEIFADQYFTQGWFNFGKSITVKAPIFHEPGLYHIGLTIDNPNDRASISDKITYNSYVKIDKNNFEVIQSSPLKQFKSGIAAKEVQCGQGLQLIMKVRDESPACVKHDTAQKLIERGWTTENFSTNHPRATQMELKAYGFVCCGLDGDLLKGYLSTSNSFVSNATVQISTNGIIMGYAKTFSDGCFQFNQWNESKLAEQTDAFLENEKKWGVYKPFNLTFTAHFAGDKNYGSSTMQTASTMSLTAVPMAPPQFETTLTPTQVNLTQGSSTNFQISIRPMVEQWNIPHLNLYLEGYPCETDFRLSQSSDNITASTTHPALFDGTASASTDSPSGKYFVHMMQNGTNRLVANDIGTLPLNVMKMK